MPIRFTYDPDLRILFTTAEGLLTFAEIQKHLEEEHTQRALGYRELVDATNATTNVTSNEVRLLVAELQIMMPSTPFGPTSVVTTNDVLFGMASMLAILTELRGGPKIAVFRDGNAALDWLLRA